MAKKQLTWTNEKRKLRDLTPWEHNPRYIKDKQAERLLESFNEFGQVLPICIGPRNEVYDGHQRRNVIGAADEYGLDYEVDVRVASRELSERERQKLTVYLHQGAQGSWDWEELANSFDFDDLVLWGFDEDMLLNMGSGNDEPAAPSDAEPQIDKAAELLAQWQVQPGDLWHIGEHRLACGDCTDASTVARLMGGESIETLLFDPEWDSMPNPPTYTTALVFTDGGRIGEAIRLFGPPTWLFVWDCVSCWYTPNRPLRRTKHCLWYGELGKYDFNGAHYGDAGTEREVWNTRGNYTFKPDPRGKHLADLYSQPITKLHAESEHNHSKPLDWITMLVANCATGDIFDPFAGSGTTLVACQNISRRCRAIELSPAYCSVILQRMTDAFPGIEIERIS